MKARLIVALVALVAFGAGAAAARGPQAGAPPPVSRAFTYQGKLRDGGQPANGVFDFRFSLYDANSGGSQVGPIVTTNDITVTSGLFTVLLDFTDVFSTNTQLYLAVAVRPGASGGAYASLLPRQPITAAPLASGLVLPAAQSVSSAATALAISNTGSGGAGSLASASAFFSLYVVNSGSGGGIRSDTGANGARSAITGYNYGNDRYAAELEIIKAANPRAAVYARTAGAGQGVDAEINTNTTGDALFARTTSTNVGSLAGVFIGNVNISGTLSKSAGTFKIDHPLDPANKYLFHSFVESPDMMNIYNGNVTLDAQGAAMVTLPDWFEALNMEFRYQLTAIGGPGPNLYVAKEISGNQFSIAGGSPGLKVSWQVTGIRHDAYAAAHRVQVETDKPLDERGTYLHPELFGQSMSRALDRVTNPLRALPEEER